MPEPKHLDMCCGTTMIKPEAVYEVKSALALVRACLYGEPLDQVGNRDDNGLNAHVDVNMVNRNLKTAEKHLEKLV